MVVYRGYDLDDEDRFEYVEESAAERAQTLAEIKQRKDLDEDIARIEDIASEVYFRCNGKIPATKEELRYNTEVLVSFLSEPALHVYFEDGSTVNPEEVQRCCKDNPDNVWNLLSAHMENGKVNFAAHCVNNDEEQCVFAMEVGKDGSVRGKLMQTPEEYIDFREKEDVDKPGFLDYLVHLFASLFGIDDVVSRYERRLAEREPQYTGHFENVINRQEEFIENGKQETARNNLRISGIKLKDDEYRYIPYVGKNQGETARVRMTEKQQEKNMETVLAAARQIAFDKANGGNIDDRGFTRFLSEAMLDELNAYTSDPNRTLKENSFAITNVLLSKSKDKAGFEALYNSYGDPTLRGRVERAIMKAKDVSAPSKTSRSAHVEAAPEKQRGF